MKELPIWARALATKARFDAFKASVERALDAQGADYVLEDGSVRLRVDHGQAQLGLMNLAQSWAALVGEGEGDAGSDALVAAHFELMGRRVAGAKGAGEDPWSARTAALESARPLLRVRLFNERSALDLAEVLVQRRLARGLHAALVFDLPDVVRPLSPQRLTSWREADAELDVGSLWEAAIAQTQAELRGGAVVEPMALYERVPAVAVTGDSFLVTSRILGLGEVLPAQSLGPAALGALVVAPNRHTLLAHPLLGQTDVATALTAMQKAGAQLYERGPGSLSPELYWWRDGALEHIHTGRDKLGRLVLGAPEAFMTEVVGED